jgi:hypothetical protein
LPALPAQNPQNAQNFSRFPAVPAETGDAHANIRPVVAFYSREGSMSVEQSPEEAVASPQQEAVCKPPLAPGASPINGQVPPPEHRWKPGQSGNPGGRPKGQSITASLRALLEKEHNGKRIVELLAERIMKEALAGKFLFAKEVIDRADGRVSDKVEVENTSVVQVIIE